MIRFQSRIGSSKSWSQVWTYLALGVIGLCFLRVLAVQASESERVQDIDEEYASTRNSGSSDEDSEDLLADADNRKAELGKKSDLKFSTPEQRDRRRIVEEDDPAFAQIENAEVLRQTKNGDIALEKSEKGERGQMAKVHMPRKKSQGEGGRKIASVSDPKPQRGPASAGTPVEENWQGETVVPLDIPVRDEYVRSRGLQQDSRSPLGGGREVASAGAGVAQLAGKGRYQEAALIASEEGFFPSRVVATQGVALKLYLSTSTHGTSCFMLDRFGVKKGVKPGEVQEIAFTPTEPGEFRFYCPIHALEGRLIVRAPASEPYVVAVPHGVGESESPPRER